MMEDSEIDPEVRRKCAVDLLDRAWGKPTESVEVNATAQSLVQIIVPQTIPNPDEWAARTRAIEEVRRTPLIEAVAEPAANGHDKGPEVVNHTCPREIPGGRARSG
jgi:hypothetical protein